MSHQQTQQQDSLILGDRINYPYLLANALLNFQNAIIKVEGQQSEQEVREAVLCIYTLIPDVWTKADKDFHKDKKKAVITRKIDVRKEWCHRKIGEPKFEDEEVIDPYKLLHACINVFQRRGLLSKTIFTEKMVPEPEDFEKAKEDKDDELPLQRTL